MASGHRAIKEATVSHLSKVTRLSREDVTHLIKRFYSLCSKEPDKLFRDEFTEELNTFFNITDDVILDRIFKAFDTKFCGALRLEDYVVGIAVYLNGSPEERFQLCFKVYDGNHDGYITRDEMYQLLKSSLVFAPSEDDPEESVKELIEMVIKKMDRDHDGRLSFTDFKKSTTEDHLLLESLGQCLPDEKSCTAFLDMIRMFGGGNSSTSPGSINISQQKERKRRAQMQKGVTA